MWGDRRIGLSSTQNGEGQIEKEVFFIGSANKGSVGEAGCLINRIEEALADRFLDEEPVDNKKELILSLLVEEDLLVELKVLSVEADPQISLLLQFLFQSVKGVSPF